MRPGAHHEERAMLFGKLLPREGNFFEMSMRTASSSPKARVRSWV
jgi:hypothetical protein